MPKVTELFDIDWRETSFVPAGDNPPARIKFWKSDPTLTDAELEEVLREAAAETGPPSEAERRATMPTMNKRSDVVAEATRRAGELQKQDPDLYGDKSLAAVRAVVYAEAEDLREALATLPEGEAVEEAAGVPVEKAAAESPAFAAIEAAAQELRKARPDLRDATGSKARLEVMQTDPALRDRYYREQRAR